MQPRGIGPLAPSSNSVSSNFSASFTTPTHSNTRSATPFSTVYSVVRCIIFFLKFRAQSFDYTYHDWAHECNLQPIRNAFSGNSYSTHTQHIRNTIGKMEYYVYGVWLGFVLKAAAETANKYGLKKKRRKSREGKYVQVLYK